ncbi:hypothetical protein LUX57_09345 [Actinomadura madurae]|uniref:sulfurtransferase TusA family protein n=1 Tax=Actinomadura madurae TaxID=1993 RepID=UPI0020D221B4|nr:hypothetical protein [Actinomadura madurae]MCP9965313.1 hypothetical protein [Actinomadura madurae]
MIHLIATDPAAPIDLPAWCHLTGHTYVGPLPDAAAPTYALRVSADPCPTEPDSLAPPLTGTGRSHRYRVVDRCRVMASVIGTSPWAR